MHHLVALLLPLAGSILAAATLQSRDTTNPFRLHATANSNLTGWAIVNAHVAAGTNAIEVQRPSAYISDLAVLNGTAEDFDSDSTKLSFLLSNVTSDPSYEMVLPNIPQGEVGQVLSKPGAGTPTFSIGGKDYIETVGGSSLGKSPPSSMGHWATVSFRWESLEFEPGYAHWYACPTSNKGLGDVFALWFGLEVENGKLPSCECQQIGLQATFETSS